MIAKRYALGTIMLHWEPGEPEDENIAPATYHDQDVQVALEAAVSEAVQAELDLLLPAAFLQTFRVVVEPHQPDQSGDPGLCELDRIARHDPDPVRRAAYREAAREARASRVGRR